MSLNDCKSLDADNADLREYFLKIVKGCSGYSCIMRPFPFSLKTIEEFFFADLVHIHCAAGTRLLSYNILRRTVR